MVTPSPTAARDSEQQTTAPASFRPEHTPCPAPRLVEQVTKQASAGEKCTNLTLQP